MYNVFIVPSFWSFYYGLNSTLPSFPGMNPEALRGSNTGVFIGAQSSESQTLWSDSGGEFHPGYVMTGSALAMFSNRLSFALDFRGK